MRHLFFFNYQQIELTISGNVLKIITRWPKKTYISTKMVPSFDLCEKIVKCDREPLCV